MLEERQVIRRPALSGNVRQSELPLGAQTAQAMDEAESKLFKLIACGFEKCSFAAGNSRFVRRATGIFRGGWRRGRLDSGRIG